MLPVQTVMIRYMVLVYRWGSRWLGVVGARGGSLGGSMTGGCARRLGLPLPAPGARGYAKAPPVWAGGALAHIIQNLQLVLKSHSY